MGIKEKNLKELEKWYKSNRPFYASLAGKVAALIEEILIDNNIDYHSISSRAKEVDSFIEKAKNDKYSNPQDEIQDFAGIRIITFVRSDVQKVCDLIKPLFLIDEANSSDKGEELGDDKVGYRSVHYIASFKEDRTSLPEYSRVKDLCFEIQIRTLLEHAWADISHDRTYKFNNSLPEVNSIKRRFSLAAATLELVDREFDALAAEIEAYSIQIASDTVIGELNHAVDGTSLFSYLSNKFENEIRNGSIEPTFLKNEKMLIEEIELMDLRTLKDLDNVINRIKESNYYEELIEDNESFVGLLRDVMMIHDTEKYFEKAWRNSWKGIHASSFELLGKFEVDLTSYIQENDLDYLPNEFK